VNPQNLPRHTADHRIMNRLQWLAEHPSAGKPRPDIKSGYFCFPAGRHLIFYQQHAEGIKVIGILHQNMDCLVHFDNEP